MSRTRADLEPDVGAPTARTSARRDEILAIARARIAEQGYATTSMRDIADAAGLLAGSLYSHVRSKAELVGDIVVRFYDELLPRQRAVLDGDGTGAERFRAMIGEVHAVCAEHREELTILHYDWHTLSALDELAVVHQQSDETLDLWRRVIRAGKRDGSIRRDVDVEAMIRIATSSIHALIDTVRYTAHPLPASKRRQQAAQLQDALLLGVAAASVDGSSAR